jgi:hypothetical protein
VQRGQSCRGGGGGAEVGSNDEREEEEEEKKSMQPYYKSTCLQFLIVFKLGPNHQLMMKSFWGKV